MREAAREFLAALPDGGRREAMYGLDDPVRLDWDYVPRERAGLALHAMDHLQRRLAHDLLRTGLSLHAYGKAVLIVALEEVLDVLEGRALGRDPGLYHLSVFGDPAADAWGWRFEGHHVSVNYTVRGTEVSPTPVFLGTNPASLRRAGRAVLRVLAEEEDVARELLACLDGDQRRTAVLSPHAPADIVTANAQRIDDGVPEESRSRLGDMDAATAYSPEPRGLPAAAMDGGQRALLEELVAIHVDRLPQDLAARARSRLGAAGAGAVHFAWAGEEGRGRPHYYRLQGARLWIEYDNTQNDANHIHTVLRDPADDLGSATLSAEAGG